MSAAGRVGVTLAEIVEAHAYQDPWGCCFCQIEEQESFMARRDHAAHVAAAVSVWLAGRLGEADVVEAAARAMKGDRLGSWDRLEEWVRDAYRARARAALAAAADVAGGGEG